jgi:hypothetical protein
VAGALYGARIDGGIALKHTFLMADIAALAISAPALAQKSPLSL